jgi:hypothetical protein
MCAIFLRLSDYLFTYKAVIYSVVCCLFNDAFSVAVATLVQVSEFLWKLLLNQLFYASKIWYKCVLSLFGNFL